MKKKADKEIKNHKEKEIIFLFSRYLFILVLALIFPIIYKIFFPVTLYLSYFALKLFYNVSISGNTLILDNASITLIEACVAGSAYFFLTLLNFSVSMKTKRRIFSLLFSLALFLIINVLRITLFSILLSNTFRYFSQLHLFSWYFMSGIIIFFIWTLTIKIFKIKEVPFYTDLKLLNNIRKKS